MIQLDGFAGSFERALGLQYRVISALDFIDGDLLLGAQLLLGDLATELKLLDVEADAIMLRQRLGDLTDN